MGKARAHLLISGEVQGVFFRETMRRLAESYGVAGYVRNLFDGRVEAVIEGEEETVRPLIEWCYQGPPAARVDSVNVDWQEFVGEYSGFVIRR